MESTIENRVAVITETLENELEQSDACNDTLVHQRIDTAASSVLAAFTIFRLL